MSSIIASFTVGFIRCLTVLAVVGLGGAMAWAAGNKPVAVIYFTDGYAKSSLHETALTRMVKQIVEDTREPVKTYALASEAELSKTVERIAEEEIGLIILVEPHDIDNAMKIPGIYPDVSFTFIGLRAPLYLTNTQTILFRQEEGTFMIGALAAMHAPKHRIGFMAAEDTPQTRNMAYGYFQGAKHVYAQTEIQRQLGAKTPDGKIISPLQAIKQQLDQGAEVLFVQNEEWLAPAVRAARLQKASVIAFDHDTLTDIDEPLLTSLRQRYDLAMHDTIKEYYQDEWRQGAKILGLNKGYIDYVLNDANKPQLTAEIIDRMEMIKDMISQGAIQVSAYKEE